jgi:hypothetical protein
MLKWTLNISLIVIFSIIYNPIYSQYDRDILSISGGKYYKLIKDFSEGTSNFFSDTTIARGYRIRQGSKTMSDKNGNLQFVASTCRILDKNFEIMSGGKDYNSVGPLIKQEWCDQNSDHAITNLYSIPVPFKDNKYFLIYFKYRIAPNLESSKTDSLFYRTIDMSKKNGLGVVNDDEKLLFVDTSFNAETSAFTKHDNGNDWWFITNTIEQKFFIYFIDSTGINLIDTPNIGPPVNKHLLGSGQASFSTDGSKLAYIYEEDGLRLMDFNNLTGDISNLIYDSTISISEISFRRGIAFSGGDQFLYVNVGGFILYQYDLKNGDLNQKVILWEYNPKTDTVWGGYPLFLNRLQLESDCKIYGAQPDGLPFYHIIHNPNGKGDEARFELGYQTPPDHLGATITHPHWRTSTPYEDWCDTVMYTDPTSATVPHSMLKDHWMVYPNPGHDIVNITYTKDIVQLGTIRLFNQQGQLVKERSSFQAGISTLDISDLPEGIYFLHIFPENYEDDTELRPVVRKVVKM